MRLTFTKGSGKFDALLIERDKLNAVTIDCPKQGIIPHDMVHYAVESTFAHRGFLELVAQGEVVSFAMAGGESAEAIERLVETFQAEMWGGRVPIADLIATYEHACVASGHGIAPIDGGDIAAIRERIDALTEAWAQVPLLGTLTLDF